jgi:hypothetical protein
VTVPDEAAGLAAARAAILADPSRRGLDLCRALSDATDAWLAELLAAAGV